MPDGHLRHSKFVGLREDKGAREVVRGLNHTFFDLEDLCSLSVPRLTRIDSPVLILAYYLYQKSCHVENGKPKKIEFPKES
jgi:hypothetical protein